MDKILIVDDEYWVGRWLSEVLGQCPFDVVVAGICQDGEEALLFLKDTPVDILITDINMPVVSGLELIRQSGLPGGRMPKAIVISGYDEFEYARQAIELDVLAYLIKPLERQTLFDAVKKAVDALQRERLQDRSVQTGYHAAVENILVEFFHRPQEELKRQLRKLLEENTPGGPYYVLGIIQNTCLEESMVSREELKEKLEEACRSKEVFLFRRDAHTWSFLLTGLEKARGFYLEDSVLLRILKGYSWGLSGVHKDYMELDAAAGEARTDIIRKLETEAGEDGETGLTEEAGEGFLAAIGARDKERVRQCSLAAEESFLREPYNLNRCLNFYFILTGDVIKMLTDSYQSEKNEALLRLVEEGYEFSIQIQDFYSIKSICRKFLEYTYRVIDTLNESGPMTVSEIVQKVKRMIQKQYAADLNLGSIADEFSINPSYFSRKFKEETGANFVDYLARVRIEQAQSLIRNTDLPISRISSQVGFNDPKYFSRVFVSVTGEKPSAYRARCKGEAQT